MAKGVFLYISAKHAKLTINCFYNRHFRLKSKDLSSLNAERIQAVSLFTRVKYPFDLADGGQAIER